MTDTIRDRVKEMRRVRASDLIPHPSNYRLHPPAQRSALRGALAEIGFADVMLAWESPDGLQLIDGHLRRDEMGNQEVPVVVLDFTTQEEADRLLVTLDPLASMAQIEQDTLLKLLDGARFEDAGVNAMLEALANDNYVGLRPLLDNTDVVPDNTYTGSIDIPIYQPTGPQPPIDALLDRETADELISEIRHADLPVEVQNFLVAAAERHVAFNFQSIANYYAHAGSDVRALMERSALVIIDYDKAIENGFVRLKEDIDSAFSQDYPDA